jgi:hypothetical protein
MMLIDCQRIPKRDQVSSLEFLLSYGGTPALFVNRFTFTTGIPVEDRFSLQIV